MLLRGNCNAWEWKIINMVSCSLPLIIIRKGLTLKRRSLPWVFYPLGISISSVKTSGDEILSLISIQEWIFVTKKMWSFSVRLQWEQCCGSRIPTIDFRNWYFFYSHALQFPCLSMGMKFLRLFVGISSHIIRNSHKMAWEWNSHKPSVGIVYYL